MTEILPDTHQSRPPVRRRLLASLAAVVAVVGVGEVVLRLQWGFGTPILYERVPAIEYRMQPNQDVRRFGRRIVTNSLGLRCREFPPAKNDPRELRILVLGDSVINGGSNVDQSELATTLLEADLAKRLGRPVLVINISANSWGPPNLLGFVQAFGTFEADMAIVVLSSHDLVDVPDPRNTGAGGASERPWSAWGEVFSLASARIFPGSLPIAPDEGDEALATQSLAALDELTGLLAAGDRPVALALFWDRSEISAGAPRPAHDRLAAEAARLQIPVWELGPALIAREKRDGVPVMVDHIHTSPAGQAAMAETFGTRLAESGWLSE